MSKFKPWKILHIELSDGIPILHLEPSIQGLLVVFWWHGVPLGQQEIAADQLPMPSTQLANLAVQALTPALGDQLFPQGFKAPLSEYFMHQPQAISPNLQSLLTLEYPLRKLREHWSKPSVDDSASETVSVVICTQGRPEHLELCLRSLQNLSSPPQETIVVDNAPSTDKISQLLSQMSGIRYLPEPRPGLSVARNTGIRHSTGNIVAFTDDDVIVHPDWITRLRQSFQNPRVMAVTGLVLPAELETESQLIFEELEIFSFGYRAKTFDQKFFQATKHQGVPVWRIGAGANMAFRRKIFELVGYFDERLGAGASGCSEDSELWYRILAEGWLCRYEPTAVVYHYHRRELDGLRQQMYQYMRGHVVALLVQFARYKHWGNLHRLFLSLPKLYTRLFLVDLLKGFGLRRSILFAQVLGCLAGIKFYLQKSRLIPK